MPGDKLNNKAIRWNGFDGDIQKKYPNNGYPIALSGKIGKVSALGLEPRTNGLKGHCSSIELRAHHSK